MNMARHDRRQRQIVFLTHGGARRGAGRKPKAKRAGVSHGARPELSGREPLLITLKMRRDVWSLRTRNAFARIMEAFVAVLEKRGIRIVHYSIQRDHIHLIVEAPDKNALSRAVQGLCIRIARKLNAMMKRKGKVFADRFHERVLRSPRQVRNALRYVLLNARKHGVAPDERRWTDPYSSAGAFDGFCIRIRTLWPAHFVPPIALAETWLLRIGWKRAGPLLDPGARPGPL
jgi:putative transposase